MGGLGGCGGWGAQQLLTSIGGIWPAGEWGLPALSSRQEWLACLAGWQEHTPWPSDILKWNKNKIGQWRPREECAYPPHISSPFWGTISCSSWYTNCACIHSAKWLFPKEGPRLTVIFRWYTMAYSKGYVPNDWTAFLSPLDKILPRPKKGYSRTSEIWTPWERRSFGAVKYSKKVMWKIQKTPK